MKIPPMRDSWVNVKSVPWFCSKMELSMRANGHEAPKSDKARESKFGQMAPCTKDTGLTARLTAMAD